MSESLPTSVTVTATATATATLSVSSTGSAVLKTSFVAGQACRRGGEDSAASAGIYWFSTGLRLGLDRGHWQVENWGQCYKTFLSVICRFL